MIDVPHLSFSGSKIVLKSQDGAAPLPAFTKNQVVKGQVLKTGSLQNALLQINGKTVAAKTDLPLQEGAVLFLKVEDTSPVPTLKLLGPQVFQSNTVNAAEILAVLKENIWKSLLDNIAHLKGSDENGPLFRELMQDLSTRLFLKPKPELLKAFIDKSGQGWEKKLSEICLQKHIGRDTINKLISSDLKGLGSRWLALNANNEVLLERFISAIKNFQLLNAFGLEQEGKIFLPIPIQFPNNLFTVGQLLIHLHQEKKGARGKNEDEHSFYRVSFLLELSNLGPLRLDLTIRGKEIDGRFLLSKKEGILIVEKNLPTLTRHLIERGFVIQHMECHLRKAETVTQPLIKEILPEEGHSVSLMA